MDNTQDIRAQLKARNAAQANKTGQQKLGEVVGELGKYSSGLSRGDYTGMSVTYAAPQKQYAGGFSGFLQHSLDIAKQTGSLLGQAGKMGVNFIGNSIVDIASSAKGAATTLVDLPTYAVRSKINNDISNRLNAKLIETSKAYASGRMSKENYEKVKADINKEYDKVNKSIDQIANSKSAGERNREILDTTVNILSTGSLGLSKIGGKTLLEQGAVKGGKYALFSKEAIDATIQQGATSIEKVMMKNGAIRNLVTRNLVELAKKEGQQLIGESAWQFTARNSKKLAVDLLIKRPVFYQSNIDQSQSLYKHLMDGEYKGAATDAAWLAVQTLNGGPLGKAKDYAGYAKTAISKSAKGKASVLDELSKQIGTKDWKQFGEFIANSADPKMKKYAQVLQDSNLNVTRGDVKRAVDNILSSYAHLDPAKLTPQLIMDDIQKHRDAFEIFQTYVKSGTSNIDPDLAKKLVPVRWNALTRTSLADGIAKLGDDKEAWKALVNEMGDKVGFTNNFSLRTQLDNIIENSATAEDARRSIQSIEAAIGASKYVPKPLQQKLAKLGYVMAEPLREVKNNFIETEDLTKLVSNAIKDPDIFDPSAAPSPVMGAIAKAFEKMGVSPQDANQYGSRQLSQHVVARVNTTQVGKELGLSIDGDTAKGGEVILAKLQQYIEDKTGIHALSKISAGQSSLTDVRQMTVSEIQQALKTKNGKTISPEAAKELRKAVIKGFQDVPLEVRGAGDKIVDTLYGVNPMQKWYARTQSALRYTYNPFFRIQESAETKILAHVQANNLVWMQPKSKLDDAARMLEEGGIFKGQLPGEAAGDVTLGRITANLTKGQKRDLGGLALDIANHQGKDLQSLVRENPEIIDDALRSIVQYPNKGILASPLSRTLNLAFFPVRYNAKVTMLAADALAKQPPSIQKAVLHSMFTMKDWLKSDEGINWQAQHSDAIQLFKWITPVNSIEGTMKLLTGSVNSAADLGQLGGLPLGVITQILDGQGLINLNTPYVDPKTGSVFPRNTPVSVKARAATALTDLLNSTFTYPGRVLGLPGKNAAIKGMVKNFIDTNGTDFISQDQESRLTPLQKKWVEVLKDGGNNQDLIDELYQSPAPGKFNGYTLPPLNMPFNPSFDASSKYKAPKVPKTLAKGKKQKTLAPVTKQPL